ncbi:MFS transporter [Rhodoferax saidenbachensis]|uniref:MFS family arabinose efflux permease n=1 Tax=Rhodoferax saidenbachensis TaxID=1484693 RepID=A0ABU1ZID4_9BURK|nr:MFS transporter [Rhodoferax saidenbachensis]MDR7305243.1 putative MFS family arabinose efflux permease [Rhodoferax saidenbachensis]
MSKALPTHWPSVITLWLCGIVAAMQFSKVSLAFMALQSHYAVSAASMGWILSTVGVVGLLCGVTMGLFAPSIGYRRLLLTGLGLGTVLALVQSFLLPFPLFWATRAFEGASHLAVVVAAPTLMAASAGPDHRSVAMGLWSTFVGAAFAISAAVLPLVLAQLGLSAVFYLHATVLALAWVAVWVLVPVDAVPMGTHPRPAVAALLAQHVAIYTHWTTALPGLCFLCYTFMAVALLTFVPTLTGTDRLWMAAVLPIMSVAGTFCAGWLAQYWMSPLVLVRTAFMAVAAVALAAGVSLLAGWWLPPVALLLMFSAGVAGGSAFALIPYLNDQSALQARANGAVAQLGNLGSTLGPPTFALAVSIWGGPGLACVAVLCACVGTGLALWGKRHHARLQP